ncbi:unnamed protein product [Knipowitschia caucasica]|uniref:Uncharacterized protein n=1 Tax=Knipowitschia caucasica TaxID=637954 RepID=A0AAV2KIE8_KNICA
MSSDFPEEHFRCSICLDIFKKPATIPCGHNFCIECIKRYWGTRSKANCPLCKETFKSRPKLSVNLAFRDLIKKMRAKPSVTKPAPHPRPQRQSSFEVFCEVCEKEGLEQSHAVKSCLVCRESYCVNHLVPHLRDPVMTKHMLTDPGTFISSHTCRRHSRLLEMFCQTDQQLVCSKCTEREHKHHEVVSIEKESQRVLGKMKEAEADFHHLIKARTTKIQELKESLDQGKKVKEEELQRSLQVLHVVKVAMESQQGALVEQSEAKQLELEKRHEQLNKKLNLELYELNHRRGEIHQLELIDDPLHPG